MSPVSPVFQTEATVTITSKHLNNNNNNKINCLTLSSDFYLGWQWKEDVEFQIEVRTLIHIATEIRIRHASGPVHSLPSIPLQRCRPEEIIPGCFSIRQTRSILGRYSSQLGESVRFSVLNLAPTKNRFIHFLIKGWA